MQTLPKEELDRIKRSVNRRKLTNQTSMTRNLSSTKIKEIRQIIPLKSVVLIKLKMVQVNARRQILSSLVKNHSR